MNEKIPTSKRDGSPERSTIDRSTIGVRSLSFLLLVLLSSPATAQEVDPEKFTAVTLDEILEYADEHAPVLRVTRAERSRGEAARRGATIVSPYNPELEGEFGVGFDDDPGPSRVEATLKQRFEIAGQRGLRIDAADRLQDTLDARVAKVEWHLHEQVHALFRRGVIDRRRVAVERQIHAFTEELLRVARERYEAGEEPRTSVIVTRAERAKARRRLVQRRVQLVATVQGLAEATGWEDERPPLPTGELPATRPLPPHSELVKRAWAHDPQLVVLQKRRDAKSARLALARREAWPDPFVGLGWEQGGLSGPEPERTLRFVIGFPLPLWNRNQAEVARAESDLAVLDERLSARKRTLRNRVRRQVAAVEGAAEELRIFEDEVLPSFAEQLELLQEGFRLGELELLDVMNARDRLLEAQREALDARQRYVVAISELEALLGISIWEDHE